MPTKVFRSGNSLAVRLPRDIAFDEGAEVEVRRDGERIVISRSRLDMAELVARLRAAPAPRLARLEMKAPRRLWDAE